MTHAAQQMKTFARHAVGCGVEHSVPAVHSQLHVVQSFMCIVHWFFVLVRNVTSVLRLVSPEGHRDAMIEAPIFSPAKDTPYGSVKDLPHYLHWVHTIAELLPNDYENHTDPFGIKNKASDSICSLTERICKLLHKLAPSSQSVGRTEAEWIQTLIDAIGQTNQKWVQALTLVKPPPAQQPGVQMLNKEQVEELAWLTGPLADVLYWCGLHSEALEAGWLGWLLQSHTNSWLVSEPAVLVSVEHTTALLVSTVSCYVDRGSDRLSESLADGDVIGFDQSHNQVQHLWEHVRDVVTQAQNTLSKLSLQPALGVLLDANAGPAPEGLNHTFKYAMDTMNYLGSPLNLDSCITQAYDMAQRLYPELCSNEVCAISEENRAILIPDALRQLLLNHHFQQHTFTFDDLNVNDKSVIEKADSLLEFLRLYASKLQQDKVDAHGNTPARSLLASPWDQITNDQKLACLNVFMKRRNGGGHWCSMASALGFPPPAEGDTLASCVEILGQGIPNPEGATAEEIAQQVREWLVRDKLAVSKIEVNKHTFSQFAKMLRTTLVLCSRSGVGNSEQNPEKLVKVDLFTMLSACEAALRRKLYDKIEPAIIWADARPQLTLVLKFVDPLNKSNFETRKQDFGSLVDSGVEGRDQAVWKLLKEAHKVCSSVKVFADDLEVNPLADQVEMPFEEAIAKIPELHKQCQDIATELRSAGHWEDAARLHRIETTTDFMAAAIQKLLAFGEITQQLHRSVSH